MALKDRIQSNDLSKLYLFIFICTLAIYSQESSAEYGDIVINNYSDEAGIRPPIFPHWFHRIRFRCQVCHAELGFKFKAGGNKINMLKIINGKFCGACHNGTVAWSVENCQLCHTAKPGTRTQVHRSTLQKLIAPIAKPITKKPTKK